MPFHILLVDDEEIVHQTIGDYLKDCGHQVEKATDGYQALEALEKRGYDVALVDVRMPGMDGLSLLSRAHGLHPEMTMVVITGHGDPDMEKKAREQGAVGFLIKPVGLRQLDDIMESLEDGNG